MIFKRFLIFSFLSLGIATVSFSQEDTTFIKADTAFMKIKPDTTPVVKRRSVKVQDEVSAGPTKRKRSRIVNDSSKTVYGPQTTLWISEDDLFRGKKNYQPIDTSIINFHRWNMVQKYNNLYQDLGNIGTAMNPVFPLISPTIGATSGFKVYDIYFQSAEPHYFDTKSPYSRIYAVWGGNGRAITRIEFSRNIHSRWNFGFDYRPILADIQILRVKNLRQTVSHYYDFYTTYKSKDEKYSVLFNYRRIRHRVIEQGGVLLNRDTTMAGYFNAQAQPFLNAQSGSVAVSTEELRQQFHVLQQYQIVKAFQMYHSMEYNYQGNGLHADSTQNYVSQFFRHNVLDSAKAGDKNIFQVFNNEAGIKGNAAFLFYNFYAKVRSYNNFNKYVNDFYPGFRTRGVEKYIGARIAFQFDSLSELRANAEYLFGGNYKVQGSLRTPWLDGDLMSTLSKPGFMQQNYRGTYSIWNNDFTNTLSNQLSGFLKASVGPLFVSPGMTYTALHNYVFFKANPDKKGQLALPVQSSGNQQIFSPEVRMSFRFFRKITLKPQAIYSSIIKNDDGAIQIPKIFANVQLAFEGYLFKKAMQAQIGVDVHWKSAYKAPAYDPAIQQYYIQSQFTNPAFPVTDVFLNGRIKRGRFFLKYHNLMKAFNKIGYFPTPYYPGMKNILDFGFELILFD